MAKISGLGWTTMSVDNSGGTPVDIRNDCTDLNFATPRATQDITGIDKSAFERLLLLADFSITLNGVFNTATSHSVLKTVPSTSVNRTTSIGIASQTLANECVYTDYALTRASSGEFTWTTTGVLSDGTVPSWS